MLQHPCEQRQELTLPCQLQWLQKARKSTGPRRCGHADRFAGAYPARELLRAGPRPDSRDDIRNRFDSARIDGLFLGPADPADAARSPDRLLCYPNDIGHADNTRSRRAISRHVRKPERGFRTEWRMTPSKAGIKPGHSRDYLSSAGGTTRISMSRERSTCSVTLPRSSFISPERPWVAITRRSGRVSFTTREITSKGSPSSRR